jgi:hypothetical protein
MLLSNFINQPSTRKPAPKMRTPTRAARQMATRQSAPQSVALPMGKPEVRTTSTGTLDLASLTVRDVELGSDAWSGSLLFDRVPVARVSLYDDPSRSRVEWVELQGAPAGLHDAMQAQLDTALPSWDPMTTVVAEMLEKRISAKDALEAKRAQRRAMQGR